MGRVRVFLAVSLDGYIAGVNDDLSWLPTEDQPGPGAIDLATMLGDVGCLLMGRRTYDVVAGFGGDWLYGACPVHVATSRSLTPVYPTVCAVSGTMDALLDAALTVAAGKDVYVDGGDLVRQAIAADRVDQLVLTVVPILLGGGVRLFEPLSAPHRFQFGPPTTYGSMVQLVATAVR